MVLICVRYRTDGSVCVPYLQPGTRIRLHRIVRPGRTAVIRPSVHACAAIVDCRNASLLEKMMNMSLSIAPLVSLIAGVLILVVPRLLNYIVAIYLIVIGLLGLFGAGSFHLK